MSGSSPFDLFSPGEKKPKKASKPKASRAPSSRKPEKKRKKKLKWRERRPTESTLLAELKHAKISDPELEAQYQRVKRGVDQISQAIDKSCEQMEVSRSEFERHMQDPDNFPPAQWKDMQESYLAFKEYLGIKRNISDTPQGSGLLKHRKRRRSGKALKGKGIGGRKGWLPMQ
jgi:hypothetical protein